MNRKLESKPLVRLAKFFIPIILGSAVFGIIGLLLEEAMRVKYWPLITGYFFPPLGKESIIPLGVGFGIHPLVMALSIAFVDIVVALFLVWNYDLAKKVPFVGKFMIKVEEKGKNVEQKYGWIKPLRFIGVVLFVMVPFQGNITWSDYRMPSHRYIRTSIPYFCWNKCPAYTHSRCRNCCSNNTVFCYQKTKKQ